jgi:hypothetical protein
MSLLSRNVIHLLRKTKRKLSALMCIKIYTKRLSSKKIRRSSRSHQPHSLLSITTKFTHTRSLQTHVPTKPFFTAALLIPNLQIHSPLLHLTTPSHLPKPAHISPSKCLRSNTTPRKPAPPTRPLSTPTRAPYTTNAATATKTSRSSAASRSAAGTVAIASCTSRGRTGEFTTFFSCFEGQ